MSDHPRPQGHPPPHADGVRHQDTLHRPYSRDVMNQGSTASSTTSNTAHRHSTFSLRSPTRAPAHQSHHHPAPPFASAESASSSAPASASSASAHHHHHHGHHHHHHPSDVPRRDHREHHRQLRDAPHAQGVAAAATTSSSSTNTASSSSSRHHHHHPATSAPRPHHHHHHHHHHHAASPDAPPAAATARSHDGIASTPATMTGGSAPGGLPPLGPGSASPNANHHQQHAHHQSSAARPRSPLHPSSGYYPPAADAHHPPRDSKPPGSFYDPLTDTTMKERKVSDSWHNAPSSASPKVSLLFLSLIFFLPNHLQFILLHLIFAFDDAPTWPIPPFALLFFLRCFPSRAHKKPHSSQSSASGSPSACAPSQQASKTAKPSKKPAVPSRPICIRTTIPDSLAIAIFHHHQHVIITIITITIIFIVTHLP